MYIISADHGRFQTLNWRKTSRRKPAQAVGPYVKESVPAEMTVGDGLTSAERGLNKEVR